MQVFGAHLGFLRRAQAASVIARGAVVDAACERCAQLHGHIDQLLQKTLRRFALLLHGGDRVAAQRQCRGCNRINLILPNQFRGFLRRKYKGIVDGKIDYLRAELLRFGDASQMLLFKGTSPKPSIYAKSEHTPYSSSLLPVFTRTPFSLNISITDCGHLESVYTAYTSFTGKRLTIP